MVAGWREWVKLPELSSAYIHAKLDTGARTSALHAFRLKRFKRDGKLWVRFEVHPRRRGEPPRIAVEFPVLDERYIKSSNGSRELRPVIQTDLLMRDHIWSIEITLTRREEMSYGLLLGRTALRGRVFVDSGRSHLLGLPESMSEPTRQEPGTD